MIAQFIAEDNSRRLSPSKAAKREAADGVRRYRSTNLN